MSLHDEIIREGGGEPGVLRRGQIEAATARARWGPFQEGDLAERAAFLLRGIAQDHPFVDGNKRTAYEVADVFLRQNGYEIDVEGEELVGTMVEVARGRFRLWDIADWIRRNLRKV